MTQSDPRPGALPERPTEPPAPPPVSSGARPPAEPVATTVNGDLLEHTRDGVIIAMHPADGRCPHCPPAPPKVRWHRVEVASTSPDGEFFNRTVEGDDAWVAASLRALADQLDPPKRPTRADALSARGDATRDMAPRRPGSVISALPAPIDGASAQVAADIQRRRAAGRGPDPLSFR